MFLVHYLIIYSCIWFSNILLRIKICIYSAQYFLFFLLMSLSDFVFTLFLASKITWEVFYHLLFFWNTLCRIISSLNVWKNSPQNPSEFRDFFFFFPFAGRLLTIHSIYLTHIGLFRLYVHLWMKHLSLCFWRNLAFSSKLQNLLA